MEDKSYRITQDMLFSAEEIQKLRDFCAKKAGEEGTTAGKKKWAVRQMMMLLALECALRVSEIAALKLGDLHLSQKRSYIVVWGASGTKRRDVQLNQVMVNHMREFISKKIELGESVNPSDPILSGRAGKHFTETALKISWTKLLEEAGLRHRGISSARHTAVGRMVSEKNDSRWIMEQTGIKTVGFVALYADVRAASNEEKHYGENHCWQYEIRTRNL